SRRCTSCLPVFFAPCGRPRALHSVPTRRSSDLEKPWRGRARPASPRRRARRRARPRAAPPTTRNPGAALRAAACARRGGGLAPRSEEHTSELQSRENLVCRLLLEKKKAEKIRAD